MPLITSKTALCNDLCLFSDICTVRLDFEAFITAGPTTTDDTTACVDSFKATASPSGQTTPSICGLNTGDHSKINLKYIFLLHINRFYSNTICPFYFPK